jgi:hypothetical protein
MNGFYLFTLTHPTGKTMKMTSEILAYQKLELYKTSAAALTQNSK